MAVLDQLNSDRRQPPHSPVGFEGFEKRLEITFAPPPSIPSGSASRLFLRGLTRSQLDSILEPAHCTIVAQLSNADFDSYVLSESSLFVYPLKIILKTCGTTQLLSSIAPILRLAESLSLRVDSVKYTRGSFIFPHAQPAPYRNFTDEVDVLNGFFGDELTAVAYVIGDPRAPNRNWHIYSATVTGVWTEAMTVEVCMTGLDRDKASVFFKKSGDYSAREMTKLSGISEIIPGHTICDFDFDPCGYSMNGIEGAALSTVHVTPEEGFSYASYEAMGFDPESMKFDTLVRRVTRCFGPAQFSVALTCRERDHLWAVQSADVDGYTCESAVKQALPGDSCLVYMVYDAKKTSRGCALCTHTKVAKQCSWQEEEEEEEEGCTVVVGHEAAAPWAGVSGLQANC